ncbi:MAG: sigma-70 family RNA polymerase sigma factor [Rhodanobacter sp.]|nr:MAG: sigma-70 family RNA polymerase sigma factor [Rhodanobacter sp.]
MHRDKHIARAILKGYSNSSIARRHGLSPQRVRQIRQDMGLPAARVMPATIDRYRRNPVLVERDDTIIRMYQDDAPIAQIMHELAVTRAIVGAVVNKAGIAQGRQMRLTARNQRIVARYLEGVPYKDLATEFGITISLVSNVISKARGARGRRELRDSRIVARYQEGVSYKCLAAEFGVSIRLVYSVISRAGVVNRREHHHHTGATP